MKNYREYATSPEKTTQYCKRNIKVSKEKAKKLVRRYFESYPDLKRFMNKKEK